MSIKILPIYIFLTIFISCSDTPTSSKEETQGTVTDIDGNVYHTIKIGNQLWMAENLKVTHYSNGDSIPKVTDDSTWVSRSTGMFCIYNNVNSNADKYGLLYNWYVVYDSRGIAPEGWRVPTEDDFAELENFLIENGYNWDGTSSEDKIAKSLASIAGWDTSFTSGHVGNDTSTNNSIGFTALPGGRRSGWDGSFDNLGRNSLWWSVTQSGSGALGRYLFFGSSSFNEFDLFKTYGLSIRLIRD